jgi:FtsZ-interacting cell division protein YlmF
VFSLQLLRQFTEAQVTNQELINRSIVLVNGVRIALNLQQVE